MKRATKSFINRSSIALSLAAFVAFSPAVLAMDDSSAVNTPGARLDALLLLDPRSQEGFNALGVAAKSLNDEVKQLEAQTKAARKAVREQTPLKSLPTAELRKYFHEPPSHLGKRETRGLA